MMDFQSFCRSRGLVIDSPPPPGRWTRYRTVDKPRHKNGAAKLMGQYGFCQNHGTDTEVSVWRAEGEHKLAAREIQRIAQQAEAETRAANARAAERAEWIFGQCELTEHAYFALKGFPQEQVNVWRYNGKVIAAIPMRIGGALVGCQLIDEQGGKRFLLGQRSGGAEFVMGNRGSHILVEGYATGLSAKAAMTALKRPFTIHVCFSSGNMRRIASGLPGGIVIADNDRSATGERTAKEIGWPYWMSDQIGEDANDYHQRKGLFALSQSIGAALRQKG